MEDNDFIVREAKLLDHERKQKEFVLDIKKRNFAEELKTDLGNEIKKQLQNQNKKPKFAFWHKIKIALFG